MVKAGAEKIMHKKHMIAVCDILGFADRVRSRPLDEVVTASMGWFARALSHSLHKNGFPAETPALSCLSMMTDDAKV